MKMLSRRASFPTHSPAFFVAIARFALVAVLGLSIPATTHHHSLAAADQTSSQAPGQSPDQSSTQGLDPATWKALPEGLFAVMETTNGRIILSLDHQQAPLTVGNFVGLAEGRLNTATRKGLPFYDGLVFHRVIAKFMIQGGDPQGNGTGGPGYRFPDEFTSTRRFDRAGVLAMANSGPDTNGSQFFITHGPTEWLNGKHSIFGQVLTGQDVVDSMSQGDAIITLRIVRKGAAAQAFMADQASQDSRIAAVVTARQEASRTWLAQQETALQTLGGTWAQGPAGLRFQTGKAGQGSPVSSGQTVSARLVAQLTTGQVIRFSQDNSPLQLQIGSPQLPTGISLALEGMQPGEQRRAILPPALAFGASGYANLIPPWSWLILDLELVSAPSM